MSTPWGDERPVGGTGGAPHPDEARLAAARPSRVASGIAVVSHPVYVVAAVTTYVAVSASGALWRGLAWTAVTMVMCVLIPYVVLFVLIGRGVVADRHLLRREQRHGPNVAAVASSVLALLVLRLAGAPGALLVLVAAQLVSLVALSAVNAWSKASMHVAVVAGAAAVVGLRRGGWPVPWSSPRAPGAGGASGWIAANVDVRWWLAAGLCVALVGWARVRGGRHSLAQVLLGGAIGVAATVAVFGVVS